MQILVATDFSALAADAVHVAAEYARRFDARLHVVHVAWPEPGPDTHAKVERIAAAHAPAVGSVRVGLVPAAEIVHYAEDHDIDLIVVGTHGRTGFTRALVGSVAERVVRTARCPVLTVPRARRAGAPRVAVEPAGTMLRHCVVCGRESEDLICETCRAHVRGEVLEARRREEKAGR
jgi:nucleotide-binding universal stress UspA family protein